MKLIKIHFLQQAILFGKPDTWNYCKDQFSGKSVTKMVFPWPNIVSNNKKMLQRNQKVTNCKAKFQLGQVHFKFMRECAGEFLVQASSSTVS